MPRRRQHTREQILEAIQAWVIEHGHPPTIEELRRLLSLGSARTVLRYLGWLEEHGDIERWPGARGMRLLRGAVGITTRAVPIVGRAPAGPMLAAEQNIEGWVRLPINYLSPGDARFYLLRVRGNSMNRAIVSGDRLEDGDLVLVRQQTAAEQGAIVVALIDGEATIKRLAKAEGYYVLKPESDDRAHQPIVVDSRFQVQGIVKRVLKRGQELLTVVED